MVIILSYSYYRLFLRYEIRRSNSLPKFPAKINTAKKWPATHDILSVRFGRSEEAPVGSGEGHVLHQVFEFSIV
jgi:hypothetical protein